MKKTVCDVCGKETEHFLKSERFNVKGTKIVVYYVVKGHAWKGKKSGGCSIELQIDVCQSCFDKRKRITL